MRTPGPGQMQSKTLSNEGSNRSVSARENPLDRLGAQSMSLSSREGSGSLAREINVSDPVTAGPGDDDLLWWHGTRARVFISCGQRGPEARIAARIRDGLRDHGFCPYLAIQAHSSRSLTEEIYRRLRTAEYFLFIDFKRDHLPDEKSVRYRGSLFSSQELGIASFLGTDILPFLEEGIAREGILDCIQGNPIAFSDRESLPDLVFSNIRSQGWDPTSRKELVFDRNPAQHEDAVWPDRSVARYFHIRLINRHRSETANDCRVFLTRWKDLIRGKTFEPEPVELKFKHVTSPMVSIVPNRPRAFDAVIVPHEKPTIALAGVLNPVGVDSGRAVFEHTFEGPGDFDLEFAVWSREFAEATVEARLHLGRLVKEATLLLQEPTA